MGRELLHYENVCFRRDGRPILDNVNWHIEEGEHWALLGLNGAGKSTLLSMLPAYQIPTTGTLRVFGKEFGKYAWPKIKSRLGFVSSALGQFQSTLDKQVVEDIVISGAFSSIGIYQEVAPEVHQRGIELLSEFGLGYLEGHRFYTLSAGEQRRVLLARSIMANPELLILMSLALAWTCQRGSSFYAPYLPWRRSSRRRLSMCRIKLKRYYRLLLM